MLTANLAPLISHTWEREPKSRVDDTLANVGDEKKRLYKETISELWLSLSGKEHKGEERLLTRSLWPSASCT